VKERRTTDFADEHGLFWQSGWSKSFSINRGIDAGLTRNFSP
jgi:hypothetical protein